MIRLLEALRSQRTDEGFSLVEVVVAMLVLGLVSTGIAAGTGILVKLTSDGRARQVAVNLAEAKLDEDRGILDPTKIYAATTTTPVGNRTYTIAQTTSIVSDDGTDVSCGSGKTIYYRRISVQVTWTGMLATTDPVQSDTIISPNGRINDASTGSIAVYVVGAAGTGESGVKATITSSTGIVTTPDLTGPDGCTYALGLAPGTYTVSINRAKSLSNLQLATPTNTSVVVGANATAPVNFSYDDQGTFGVTYGSNASQMLPQNMSVTFLTASGAPFITSSAAAPPSTQALYPFPAGYTAVAGAEADTNGNTLCAAEDPAQWPAGTFTSGSGTKKVAQGARGGTVAASPGGSAALAVPVGTFTVNNANGVYITAVAQNAPSAATGQPGCDAAGSGSLTFKFDQIKTSSTVTLALPYGTYKIYTASSLGFLTNLLGSTLSLGGLGNLLGGYIPSSSTITLDPRSAA